MRAVLTATAAICVLALGGCVAAPTGPTVMAMPAQGKSFETFQADDATCRQYAAQQTGIAPGEAANQSLIGSAALGTVLGGAAGAAIGAAAGNPAAGAAIGAASGLALGTASGVGAAQYSGDQAQRIYDIGYMQCMSAKGESVPQTLPTQAAYAYPSYPPYYYGYAYPYPYYYPWYGPGFVTFGFHGRFRRHF